MFYTTDPAGRAAFIGSLRELADFLVDNPAVPVPLYGEEIRLHTDSFEDGGQAQVDRIARQLGAAVDDDTDHDGHYRATRQFGSIAYGVVAIPVSCKARHDAERSYWGCVTPDIG